MPNFSTITDRFTALGTTIEGGVRSDPGRAHNLFRDLRTKIESFEARFSRFQSASELSQLNRRAGRKTPVSDAMIDLLLAARRMWDVTAGLVDPTVGQAVIAAGYDASFDQLRPESPARPSAPVQTVTLADVRIDRAGKTVTLPAGVMLDFGGIGKGYLLDQLTPMLAAVTADFWYSLGGDLVVSGTDDHGRPWPVGVQDPQALERDLAWLHPPAGRWGIATSGTTKRHGVRGGVAWHHLIDPQTGRPSTSDVLAAAVLAPTTLEADALAKTVLLRGSSGGMAWAMQQPSMQALLVTSDRRIITTPKMKPLLTYA